MIKSSVVKVLKTPSLLLAIIFVILLSAFHQVMFDGLLLVLFLYFYPLFDRDFMTDQELIRGRRSEKPWGNVFYARLAGFLLVLVFASIGPGFPGNALSILLVAAVPEEWFFRYYFQGKLGNDINAVIISSGLFSCSHALSLTWDAGLMVLPASLFFGYLYLKTGDLVLVVLLHALSDLWIAWVLRLPGS